MPMYILLRKHNCVDEFCFTRSCSLASIAFQPSPYHLINYHICYINIIISFIITHSVLIIKFTALISSYLSSILTSSSVLLHHICYTRHRHICHINIINSIIMMHAVLIIPFTALTQSHLSSFLPSSSVLMRHICYIRHHIWPVNHYISEQNIIYLWQVLYNLLYYWYYHTLYSCAMPIFVNIYPCSRNSKLSISVLNRLNLLFI